MRFPAPFIRRSASAGRLALILAFLALAPMPLTADWLLLRDGTELETAGRWRLDDGLVTFALARRSGLFSLRVGEVDLAASDALTRRRRAEAARPAAPVATPPERREPVLVLTDGDVRKVRRDPAPQAEEEAAPAGPPAAGEAPVRPPESLAPGIEVSTWRQSRDPASGGTVIEGELENKGSGVAVGLELTVALTAGDGSVVASRPALLSATTLAPRQRSRFRVEFPDPGEFEDVDFRMTPLEIAEVRILWPFDGSGGGVLTI